MVVTCQACGASSHDLEFCDHCNADLTTALPPPAPRICRLGPDESLYLTAEQVKALNRPEAAITIPTSDRVWRVHWIGRPLWPAWASRVEARLRCRAAVLPPGRVVDDTDGVWVIVETHPGRVQPWKEPAPDPLAEVAKMLHFLETFAAALEELEANGLVWLTFDPQELETVDGRLRITNLDLAVHPIGSCPDPLPVRPTFAAPEVCHDRGTDVSARTDVYHLSVFAYYWLAQLLPHGFLGQGLDAFGHALPPLRIYAPTLPPGIATVLRRGLAVDPSERPASPAELCAQLRHALDKAQARQQSTTPVRWETGRHTRTGRAKFALDRPNEDESLICRYRAPDRLLAAVADGISTCSIGTGALASRLTCAKLQGGINADCRLDAFAAAIHALCHQAAQGLLDWAVEHGHRQDLLDGSDLMGTTLTAGWLEGNRLAVANLGDSRAYLITGDFVEQLTVDGDLGSGLLMLGMPPEDVRGFGGMARSLRECVGGCARNADGTLTINEHYCTPTVTTWTLVPGDVVVLCSDGLVDEGVFLEPAEVAELVRRHPHVPPEELAIKLADAADSLQRLASALEPDGFGDNITCIVIRILPSPPTPLPQGAREAASR